MSKVHDRASRRREIAGDPTDCASVGEGTTEARSEVPVPQRNLTDQCGPGGAALRKGMEPRRCREAQADEKMVGRGARKREGHVERTAGSPPHDPVRVGHSLAEPSDIHAFCGGFGGDAQGHRRRDGDQSNSYSDHKSAAHA
jgi:hypothetical protein